MIQSNAPLKIVATLLAKDEEDIIGHNIEHHINQGVTHFIVTNNRSKDRTREIVSKYPEVVEIIDEPDETHNQSLWVTRMAQLACKFSPDWIIHLDADELWCGLQNLRSIQANYIGCTRMYLHPPVRGDFSLEKMRHYLDLDHINLPGECKVAHRPDPDVQITHGNHGFVNRNAIFTKNLWRHHYPIRGLLQFKTKITDGHEALLRRNAICERWEKWYKTILEEEFETKYHLACDYWLSMIQTPNIDSFVNLLEMWSTPEVIKFFHTQNTLPKIGEWPRIIQ